MKLKKESLKPLIPPLLPLLLYPILAYPYDVLNRKVLVEKYGCSCPVCDPVTGEMYSRSFNANSVTAIVWGVIAVVCTVLSFILARRLENKRLRMVLPLIVCAIAAALSCLYIRTHFWG